FDRLNSQNNANGWLYRSLKVSKDFRQVFTDRLFEHFYNNGVLTQSHIEKRFFELADEMQQVVHRRTNRDVDEYVIDSWIPNRLSIFFNACRNEGVYTYDGPELRINGDYQHGGYASSGDVLTIHNSQTFGDVYYTTDGNDPRVPVASEVASTTLVSRSSPKRALVPAGSINDNWRGGGNFNDSSWVYIAEEPGGVGYDEASDYQPYISYDVETLMNGDLYPATAINTSAMIRIPFTVSAQDRASFNFMTLKVQYDDGFIAFINGHRIDYRNFSGNLDDPDWNANASTGHEASASFETFDVTDDLGKLEVGDNILAVQGLNTNWSSSDFIINAELVAGRRSSSGGSVSPSAVMYTGGWTLNKSTEVKARVLNGETWSALTEATFALDPVLSSLRITEIMYHPQDTNDPEDPNEEFVELKNIGSTAINLNHVMFTNGIDFTFGDIELSPGGYVLVVKKQTAFDAAYPGFAGLIAGEYSGSLNNGGEKIELQDAAGQTIHDFRYDDDWREATDGGGHSLTIIDAVANPMLEPESGLEAHWKFDDGSGTNAADSAGDNDGRLLGGASWAAGIFDGALKLEGANAYVSLAEIDALTGTDVTIATWVRPSQLTGGWNPLLVQHIPDASGDGYYLYLSQYKPVFSLASGGNSSAAISPTPITMDEWHHIVGTNDASSLRIYVNGDFKGSESSLGRTGAAYRARIGYESSLAHYDGLIDDMRIYNRALSEEEVHQAIDPLARWGEKRAWRASVYAGGSPGYDDSGILPNPGAIVINEILAHSHDIAPDWIELHNTTEGPIDIGGWYLSDSKTDLMKYQFADGTEIGAGKYLILIENANFGEDSTDPGKITGFAFSENGDTAYLSSGEDDTLTGYRAVEDFGASARGMSFGRYFKRSTGNYNFVVMHHNTPGQPNAYPAVGPVVITEIMYNPDWPATGNYTNNEYEFVELHNITDQPVRLYDDGARKPWKFTDGIDYEFPAAPGLQISAGGYVVIAKNVTAYFARYGPPPFGVFLLGPYGGKLSDAGEKLELSRPGDIDELGQRQYIRVDRVNYGDGTGSSDSQLWPAEADGGGLSLNRIIPGLYGNDPNNWKASTTSPGLPAN
ncbi:MAG: lamin tail domain-containing protein, partial [Planctomycetota bacterium]